MQTITIEQWAEKTNTLLQNMQKAMQATGIEEPASIGALLDQYADISQQMNSPMSIGLALEKLIEMADGLACKVIYRVEKEPNGDQLKQECQLIIRPDDDFENDIHAFGNGYEHALLDMKSNLGNAENLLCDNLLPQQETA